MEEYTSPWITFIVVVISIVGYIVQYFRTAGSLKNLGGLVWNWLTKKLDSLNLMAHGAQLALTTKKLTNMFALMIGDGKFDDVDVNILAIVDDTIDQCVRKLQNRGE